MSPVNVSEIIGTLGARFISKSQTQFDLWGMISSMQDRGDWIRWKTMYGSFDTIGRSANVEEIVPVALDLYWVLAIGAALVTVVPIPGIDWFRNAVIVSACRGKLTEQAPENALGPLSDIFVPQKWFAHFYMAGCVCNALVLNWVYQSTHDMLTACLPIFCFQIHLTRRLLETLFMMKYPEEARMHVIAYMFGLTYYVVVPLTYGTALQESSSSYYFGAAIFVLGNLIQWHSHYVLSLMSTRGRGRYIIPRDGLFKLVSCPHYFGEIVIYLGLATMMVRSPIRVWYPFIWVVVNLALAANMTHTWYTTHFKTYPAKRKMLVPYVY